MNAKKIIGWGKRGPIFQIKGAADEDPIERLQARQVELLAEMEVLNSEIDESKGETRSAKETRFTEFEAEFKKNEDQLKELRAEVEMRETRSARLAAARAKYQSLQVKSNIGQSEERFDLAPHAAFSRDARVHTDLVSRSLSILDDKAIAPHLRSDQREQVERVLRTQNGDTDGQLLSAYLIATSNPAYRSAFQKSTGSLHPVFTPEEGRAVSEVQTIQRAMAIGSSGTGGFAVPVIIDPTIIMTAQGTENDILQLARVVTITNDRWKGIASSGVTWKFDAEAAPANDNSPTITQPEVPTYRADGFIPYSIEVGQDWPGFAEEMSRMLASGYDELLAEKLTVGSAANTPRGIVSRLTLQTSPDVSTASLTAGTIAGADLYDMWGRLPQRHRRSGSTAWMSSTGVQNAVRQMGTVDPNFTVNITEGDVPRLFGKPYHMNDYMANPAAGTAAANLAIVGNWQGYLVAQRAGMNIEFVPMLFDPTNNRPTGQRGWFAYARIGADVVDPTAFQLLQNKTS
jgi:HK97 family phage major capsid protein